MKPKFIAFCLLGLAVAALPAQTASCSLNNTATGVDTSDVISALNVRLPTATGDSLDLGAVAGQMPLVLFRVVISPSGDSMARLVARTAGQNPHTEFVGVLCDTGPGAAEHVRKLALDFPVVLNPGGRMIPLCHELQCTPSVVFVGISGDLVMNSPTFDKGVLDQGLKALAEAGRAIDPVCGQTVQKASSPSAKYNTKVYYFCSENCHDLFIRNPPHYVKN